jgi:lipid-A-disaccharide synthase
MAACDLALVTSGTATLEVMLHKKPMIIAYKTNFITYQIGKKIVKVPFIGLPNLLANSRVAPEYIQTAANATNLSQAIMNLLTSNTERDLQINTYKSLHVVLQQDANKTAARIVMELLGI